MPTLPRVTTTVNDGQRSTGFAGSANTLLVAGCCSAGATNTMALYKRPSTLVADHGYGPAVEVASQIMKRSGKRVLFLRMPSTTVGSNSAVDSNDATGTSVVTLSGTPLDDYEGELLIVTAGTRGTAGVTFKYSLDGGRTYSTEIALGTAVSYAIPNSGLTLDFAAGDFDAADVHTWTSTAPRWATSDLDELTAAMAANTTPIVGGIIVGDLIATDVTSLDTALGTYATTNGRFTFFFANARNRRPTRRARGTYNLTFTEVGASGDTIVRSAGSWITDGFVNGDSVTIAGSVSNDGTYPNVTVTNATTLTLGSDGDLVTEGPVAATATATEPETVWMAAVRATFDAVSSKRLSVSLGHAPTLSEVSQRQYQRPASWGAAARYLAEDLARSLADVGAGAIPGVSLVDEHGDPIGHDEAAVPGALDGRFLCYRTFDGRQGAYIALPMMFAPTGSDFDRVHLRAIVDLACTTAKSALEGKLSASVLLDKTTQNTIDEQAALTIEAAVNRALRIALTDRGRVTSAVYSCARDDDLTAATPTLTGQVDVTPLGYLESISTTVQLAVGE